MIVNGRDKLKSWAGLVCLFSRSLHLRYADASSFLDLGSDHRTVTAVFGVAKVERSFRRTYFKTKGWQPQLDENGDPSIYHMQLTQFFETQPCNSLSELERALVQIFTGSGAARNLPRRNANNEPWTTDEFQLFLRERRETQNRQERTRLSKEIRKHLRKQLRAKRNKRVTQILDEFCALNRLDSTFRDPIRSQKQIQKEPQPEEFANYLGDVFRSDVGHNASVLDMLNVFASSHGFHSIPPFQFPELEYVLSQMPCNKATDATGVVVEMFKHGNVELHTCLLNIFNGMLKSGCFDESWRATLFTMLPKMGDTSRPSCWRPIAILKISYKIFSKLICQRLRITLDSHQSIDQTGFRPGTGIEDAFLVFESLCSKSLEWNLPLWFASLDLTKAFDRVEYGPLFEALLEQGVPKPYCALLWKLYQNQSGKLQQGHGFSIQRGVRQGDVISPILFNAVLESAMRKWKRKLLASHGLVIAGKNYQHQVCR